MPENSKSVDSGNEDQKDLKAYTQRTIVCPHCEGEINVQFCVDISKWTVPKQKETPTPSSIDPWLRTLNPSQIATLDASRRSGLLDCFEYAIKSSSQRPPRNIEKFFLQWFQMCRANALPSWALQEFRDLYPGKLIEFFSHAGIGAVIAGGAVSLFVPMQIISGTRVEMAGATEKRIPADLVGVQQWIKTRMGYVPTGARVALSVMRARCIGEFARPAI